MARHRFFLGMLLAQAAILAALFLASARSVRRFEADGLAAGREVVERLALTDLAVWTEARYTRHPSQADGFAPFQDFPGALDHFPAGSIVAPPAAAGPRGRGHSRSDEGAP